MPKKLEQKLKREAVKKGLGEKRTNAYVYGTLRKTGWTPSTQKNGMEKAHAKGVVRVKKSMA